MDSIDTSGMRPELARAIEEMQAEYGPGFKLEALNLAELERRTGISRAKLRRLKENGFVDMPHGLKGRKAPKTLLTGYTATLDKLLKSGVTNSAVCLKRLQENGFPGGLTIVKDYIAAHQELVPAKRCLVAPQGNRGRRYTTEPGEAFQMDWGFTKVLDYNGNEYTAACFAMICHHCGQRYVEFFPTVTILKGFQAELAEIDENFIRRGLSTVEHGELLLRRKTIYETLHPDTKAGRAQTAEMNRAIGNDVTGILSATCKSFVEDTAEKLGVTPRTVRRQI